MPGDDPDGPSLSIPDRVIASALEFAVGVAAHGARQQPPLPCPAVLRRYFSTARLNPRALAAVRAAIEGDPEFQRVLAATVRPGSVDPAGMLWIQQPDNWRQLLAELVDGEQPDVDADPAGRRFDRRREQAERTARDALAETAALRAQQVQLAEELRAATERATRLDDEIAQLRATVAALRGELERTRASLDDAATGRTELELAVSAAQARAESAEAVRDDVLAARIARTAPASGDGAAEIVLEGATAIASDLAAQAQVTERMADELRQLARQLRDLEPARRAGVVGSAGELPRPRNRRRGRRPVPVPGEVYGRSDLEAAYLARHPGMQVVVDGYNVAKLGWPQLDLATQRDRCVAACEDVARRYGSILTVVFDGTTVPGASASGRRLVGVRFSPDGVLADDVIRAMVDQLPDEVPVLVVTNDQAVVADVRSAGANVLTSETFLSLSGR
jgi:uncharacterized coiled-coil protein SlyX